MENTYTISDIVKQTGLKEKFIRNCVEALKDNILRDSIKRGNKNSLLFDSNTIKIFDFIKQKHSNGYSISTIKQQLLSENMVKHKVKTKENKEETEPILNLLNDMKDLNKSLLEAKDIILEKEKEIFSKDTQIMEQSYLISNLKNNLKLITDGRNPQEIREEQIRKEEELKKYVEENSNIKSIIINKELEIKTAKSLVDLKEEELKKQKHQIENIELSFKNKEKHFEEQKNEIENKIKHSETRRKELLKELESLEGKWFVGAKRKELLKKLEEQI